MARPAGDERAPSLGPTKFLRLPHDTLNRTKPLEKSHRLPRCCVFIHPSCKSIQRCNYPVPFQFFFVWSVAVLPYELLKRKFRKMRKVFPYRKMGTSKKAEENETPWSHHAEKLQWNVRSSSSLFSRHYKKWFFTYFFRNQFSFRLYGNHVSGSVCHL